MSVEVIDLRSDTVTQPTAAMRHAMANAEVGDDVYSEDPTVNRLEARAAEVFGREAAVFVPTGTMGNQIALRLHTKPGQEVVCDARAHVLDWEMGMAAVFSGCQLRTVPSERGVLRLSDYERGLRMPGPYFTAHTGLIWMENTHNMGGGSVTDVAGMREVIDGAHARGLPVHVDGARIFNAAVALSTDVATLTAGANTVNFCLSKGLCAPVGSVLVGSKAAMEEGKRLRKALGGGMRQAGVLAAAGLIALDEMPKRLHEDHENARTFAERISQVEGVSIELSGVETNIVIFDVACDAVALVTEMRARGVRMSALGPHRVRAVTHRDVDAAMCTRAADVIEELMSRN